MPILCDPRSYKCGCSRYCKILRPVSKTTYYDHVKYRRLDDHIDRFVAFILIRSHTYQKARGFYVVLQWASGSPALRSSTCTRGTEPLSRTMVNGHTRLDSERGALKEQPHREGPLSWLSSLGLSLSAFLSSGCYRQRCCSRWRCSCVGRFFTVVAVLVGVVVVVGAIVIVVAASPLSWPPRRGCCPRCCCIAFIVVACRVVVAAAFAASSWALLVAIVASP
ncbi:hypothetical protein EDB85DRAFT_2030930 [Lactarius pseudohatsudake]|nr:hypothetical protein EDB85DRAFT_2030930 [Lactarius pseudohatsudake]